MKRPHPTKMDPFPSIFSKFGGGGDWPPRIRIPLSKTFGTMCRTRLAGPSTLSVGPPLHAPRAVEAIVPEVQELPLQNVDLGAECRAPQNGPRRMQPIAALISNYPMEPFGGQIRNPRKKSHNLDHKPCCFKSCSWLQSGADAVAAARRHATRILHP